MIIRTFLLAALLLPVMASAQLDNAAFTETGRGAVSAFVTDYQALGINPANLAFGNQYNKKYTLGLGQVGISFYSEAFDRNDFTQAILGVDDDLTLEEKRQAGLDFAQSDLALNTYTTMFGFAMNTENAGSFAVSLNFRTNYYSKFNDVGANQLFNGYIDPYFDQWQLSDGMVVPNGGPDSEFLDEVELGVSSDPQFATDLYSDMRIKAMAFTELNFGYGRHVYESDELSIFAGAGVKYLQGLFVMDLNIENNEVTDAYIAATPALGIDLGDGEDNPSFVEGDGYTPVGSGFGFDLGVAAEISEQFRVSASVVDIGSVLYDGNVYTSADTVVFDIETQGINSYNVFTNYDAFAGDDGVFEWNGEEERRVKLPTQFRAGMGYFHNERLRVGLDFAFPLNDEAGSIENFAFAFGAEYLPSPGVRLSAGIGAGDNYGFRVPFGVNFVVGEGSWELGFATRDLMYAFRDKRPNLSLVMGLLRFRFGEMEQGSPSRMF